MTLPSTLLATTTKQRITSSPSLFLKTTMPINPIGLTRYDSALDSVFSNLILPVAEDVNLLIGSNRQFFPPGDSHSESSCNVPADPTILSSAGLYGSRTEVGTHNASYYTNALQVAAGDLPMSSCRPIGHDSGMSSQLFRHSSSPAEFLSNVMVDNGLTVTRGGSGYSAPLLKSQLSFSSRQGSITHAFEISSDDATAEKIGHTYMTLNIQIGSWDDSNSFVLSAPPAIKHGNDNNEDIMASLGSMIDSHTYDLSNNPVDMANNENIFQIQEEIVPCRIRAKRGCATHPRSIAERERRTRISEKLRKLQEIVPNMDKQTSTADMLDLAVQHIKGLQSQIQSLKEETAICTCSSKQDMYI